MPARRSRPSKPTGWSARAGTYDALMARATALAVEPLLDAAGVGPGVRVLDVGCGLGALAAAAAARGARGDRRRPRRRHARGGAPAPSGRSSSCTATPRSCRSPTARFDVALGAFIVNHLPHPERAAAELAPRRHPRRAGDVGPGGRGRDPRPPRPRGRGPRRRRPARPGRRCASPTRGARSRCSATTPSCASSGRAPRRLARRALGRRPRRHRPHRRPARRRAPRRSSPRPAPHLTTLAEPYRTPAGYALPITIRIAATPKPHLRGLPLGCGCSRRPGP